MRTKTKVYKVCLWHFCENSVCPDPIWKPVTPADVQFSRVRSAGNFEARGSDPETMAYPDLRMPFDGWKLRGPVPDRDVGERPRVAQTSPNDGGCRRTDWQEEAAPHPSAEISRSRKAGRACSLPAGSWGIGLFEKPYGCNTERQESLQRCCELLFQR